MYVLGCLTQIHGLLADEVLGRKLVPVEIDIFVFCCIARNVGFVKQVLFAAEFVGFDIVQSQMN